MTHGVLPRADVFRRVRCFSDGLRLGLLPVHEVETLLQCVPLIRLADDTLLRNDPRLLHAVYGSLSKGLRRCRVLRLADLDPRVLRRCFEHLRRASPSWGVLTFAREILAVAGYEGLRLENLSSGLAERLVEDCAREGEGVSEAERKLLLARQAEFLDALRDLLPKGIFIHLITAVTERLLVQQQQQEQETGTPRPDRHARVMAAWARLLGNLTHDLFAVPRVVWSDVGRPNLCRPLPTTQAPSAHQLFARLWTSVALAGPQREEREESPRFFRIFTSLLATLDRTCDDPPSVGSNATLQILARLHLFAAECGLSADETTARLIYKASRVELAKAQRKLHAWLDSCGLQSTAPATEGKPSPADHPQAVSRRLCEAQTRRLEELERHTAQGAGAAEGVAAGLAAELGGPHSLEDMLQNWALYTRTRQASRSAYARLAQNTDITDAATVEKMLMLAVGGPIPRSLLMGLLAAHQPLHAALASLTGQPQPCTHSHHPEAYLNTIHALALTLAHAPYLSPTESWRFVHRLYRLLRRHGAPVRPVMGRALVQAGVHRAVAEGQRVPLPRWGLASRTHGRLYGFDAEVHLNQLVLDKAMQASGEAGDGIFQVRGHGGAEEPV
ncbi:hypothetical protein KEM52_005814 [Ascosphaera acerosa]|nr:hypothetical protein KEM52_005814 [Ascosphaera acerosa]